jgi:hypothetical protein
MVKEGQSNYSEKEQTPTTQQVTITYLMPHLYRL